jgi:hypothetical protein
MAPPSTGSDRVVVVTTLRKCDVCANCCMACAVVCSSTVLVSHAMLVGIGLVMNDLLLLFWWCCWLSDVVC